MKTIEKAPARGRDEIQMVDGRKFVTFDNWQTVLLISKSGKTTKLTGTAADRVRYLAVAQSSAGP